MQDTKQEAASQSSQAEGSWQPVLGQEGRKIKRRWDFALSFTEDFIPSRHTTEAFPPLEIGRRWPSCLLKLLLGHAWGKLRSAVPSSAPTANSATSPCSPRSSSPLGCSIRPQRRCVPTSSGGINPVPALASCPLRGDVEQLAHNK